MLNISEEEAIYFQQTKQYFKEVTTSYEIGNYRSSIVMLYSMVVCDLLLKLEELVNTNNDGVAKEILDCIETTRNEKQTSGQWEWELIRLVREKTDFLDNEAYANIEHLYSYRNMCAHPAVNDQYELYQPNKETTIAFIRNTLNTVLIKPPTYIRKVINLLTDDIAEKKEIYVNDPKNFKVYLDNKYYNRMSLDMKLKTAKALWKFVFVLEDEECNSNRRINFWALVILSNEIPRELEQFIKKNNRDFNVASNVNQRRKLVNYLSKTPCVWNSLKQETQYQIKDFISKDDNAKALSWFLFSNEADHLNSLKNIHIDTDIVSRVVNHYKEQGMYSEALDFCIRYFGESTSFDSANIRFDTSVAPYVKDMTCEQLIRLISEINGNNQLYNRWNSTKDNSLVVFMLRTKHGENIELNEYENFKFSEDYIQGLKMDQAGDPQ